MIFFIYLNTFHFISFWNGDPLYAYLSLVLYNFNACILKVLIFLFNFTGSFCAQYKLRMEKVTEKIVGAAA